MRRLAVVWLLAVVACEDEEPCDRYVDYMCECHADDPGFDCDELVNAYVGADGSIQDECALELSDQRDLDDQEGLDCTL